MTRICVCRDCFCCLDLELKEENGLERSHTAPNIFRVKWGTTALLLVTCYPHMLMPERPLLHLQITPTHHQQTVMARV